MTIEFQEEEIESDDDDDFDKHFILYPGQNIGFDAPKKAVCFVIRATWLQIIANMISKLYHDLQ